MHTRTGTLRCFRWDCIQLYIKAVGLGLFAGKHIVSGSRHYYEILPGTMWSAAGCPAHPPRPGCLGSRYQPQEVPRRHFLLHAKQWPLSRADMVWPQLRLPCLPTINRPPLNSSDGERLTRPRRRRAQRKTERNRTRPRRKQACLSDRVGIIRCLPDHMAQFHCRFQKRLYFNSQILGNFEYYVYQSVPFVSKYISPFELWHHRIRFARTRSGVKWAHLWIGALETHSSLM